MPLSPTGGKIGTDLPNEAWEADHPACRHATTIGFRRSPGIRIMYPIFPGGVLVQAVIFTPDGA